MPRLTNEQIQALETRKRFEDLSNEAVNAGVALRKLGNMLTNFGLSTIDR